MGRNWTLIGACENYPRRPVDQAVFRVSLWAMDRASRRAKRGFFRGPLAGIGVREEPAYGDVMSLSGLQQRHHKGVFSGGPEIGGFVDSGAETLVPSASGRSTAEWTPVDSVDSSR